jgi:hypothetical protein
MGIEGILQLTNALILLHSDPKTPQLNVAHAQLNSPITHTRELLNSIFKVFYVRKGLQLGIVFHRIAIITPSIACACVCILNYAL